MYKFPIGILMESLLEDDLSAIKTAQKLGVKGMQMYAVAGSHSPEEMNTQRRKELLDMMKSHGLCFSALCGDLGQGFWRPERNPELIEKSKRIIDMAMELETNIVTTHIGVIPTDENNDRYKIMQEACFELSRYADSLNAHFAIETGTETADVLKSFLDSLNSKGVAVNLDPANLVMDSDDDPVKAVYTLRDYIVHTHAKDGVYVQKPGTNSKEVPLGSGGVDFPNYLKALDEIGYKGFLTIERECGENPKEDIETAVKFLENLLEA